ncbi:hypothetical protein F5Y15DRAFT_419647 [Xylariaceae sp. FL0016]|nr:hypothetical protein F5Y15DRAFT_419647 [Xylariaceae sp. FL0016]
MSRTLFCCSSLKPYRPSYLLHQLKFDSFMDWARFPKEADVQTADASNNFLDEMEVDFVIQLVRQVNFGPLESTRYFARVKDNTNEQFVEVEEKDLVQANFKKLNSYKNFKCDDHNKFFELNVYQKDPVNKHHWRMNAARPASSIDLSLKNKE